MIKRAKRNYVVVILMSCFMIFTIVFALSGFDQALSYGEASGIIRSVNVRQVESGTYDDRNYYTESTVKYDYTVGKRPYARTTYLRDDYTGREGEQVTVIYDKRDPGKSDIGSRGQSLFSGFSSLIGSVVLLIYIIYDINVWTKKRKSENMQIDWDSLSSEELRTLDNEKKSKTNVNIILLLTSTLCTFLLFFFAIPLWSFTIARIMDVKLCYPKEFSA